LGSSTPNCTGTRASNEIAWFGSSPKSRQPAASQIMPARSRQPASCASLSAASRGCPRKTTPKNFTIT
jgi:hypothetical protein